MEFFQIKRGHQEEQEEEDKEEVIRDVEGNPIYTSSSSYRSNSNHQRLCLGPSIDAWAGSSSGVGSGWGVEEREHMFHKVVTPSDVGKLNRLVIPKQHAEKYFPLDHSLSSSANNEQQQKGLLLNFEDRNGKEWRFRYSYWNSSQSYVMTKGWSRFVKDKKLDAGDIVSFDRGVGESGKDRLFIDWRHRQPSDHHHHTSSVSPLQYFPPSIQWGRLIYPPPPSAMSMSMLPPNYVHHHQNQRDHSFGSSGTQDYGGGAMNLGQIGDIGGRVHSNAVAAAAAPKRLRLFGVNMDCSSIPIQENKAAIILPSVPFPFSSLPPPSHSRQYDGTTAPNADSQS